MQEIYWISLSTSPSPLFYFILFYFIIIIFLFSSISTNFSLAPSIILRKSFSEGNLQHYCFRSSCTMLSRVCFCQPSCICRWILRNIPCHQCYYYLNLLLECNCFVEFVGMICNLGGLSAVVAALCATWYVQLEANKWFWLLYFSPQLLQFFPIFISILFYQFYLTEFWQAESDSSGKLD